MFKREQGSIVAELDHVTRRIDAHFGDYADARADLDYALGLLANCADITAAPPDSVHHVRCARVPSICQTRGVLLRSRFNSEGRPVRVVVRCIGQQLFICSLGQRRQPRRCHRHRAAIRFGLGWERADPHDHWNLR